MHASFTKWSKIFTVVCGLAKMIRTVFGC
jgi:hypothetical protein